MWFFNWFKKKETFKPKLGLALGSGGAKGFAHIGALKAFEESGLEFDYIAGTSIGSIIGAFYANGYTSTDMLQLMKSIDLNEIKTLFMFRMDTGAVERVINKALGDLTFDELKKPFIAVTTDSVTGREYDINTGSVAKALCASSAYPPFFKPVKIGEKSLVDGAYVNVIPSNLVKDMGADYIVGIDLGAYTRKERTGFLSELFPNFNVVLSGATNLGYSYSDVMLKPELAGYKSTAFTAGDEMYELGYKEAKEKIPKILADIENLKKMKKK